MPELDVVVLAAGKGTRMRSQLPKVLHPIGGRPMLSHVLDTARLLNSSSLQVVYGHGGDLVREQLADSKIQWVHQAEQRGTGHAVAQAMSAIGHGKVLILFGDVPLLRIETLRDLLQTASASPLGILTAQLENPDGYGRILRAPSTKAVTAIVEHKDASEEQRRVAEINTGVMVADADALRRWIDELNNDNTQGEYYLTDIVASAGAQGVEIATTTATSEAEIVGVNDRSQLAYLERIYQARVAQELMNSGATLMDPARVDVRGTLTVDEDVTIDVNSVFEGVVHLGSGVHVGPNAFIRDACIGAKTEVLANCVIEEATTGTGCRIGPFARLRPGAELADHVHVGNFVEIKKSKIGTGSKINHLTYVGDADVGKAVNIGAGTITCNYDGANKHRTVIGDGAFIGSGVELVAPVTIGADATIGAGSTIGRDAPAGALTVERSRQKSITTWKRPVKET
jgi:bifunctional UDP-N-acetylglucosamine pyrophosphorylase/glucosamine-1-phosphate N-acetyltransferase